MNKRQFSKVLKAGMRYYIPYTRDEVYNHNHMCFSLYHARDMGDINQWELDNAIAKIEKLIHPDLTLQGYLRDKRRYVTYLYGVTDQMLLDFWDKHIIGDDYNTPANQQKISS